jgi:DNA-binding MarR family transcriptional regulator
LVRREPDQADTRAVRVALTSHGSRLAAEFYAETCRRIDRLPAGLSSADRNTLADLLGRVVLDNKVPVVFLEQDEGIAIRDAN